MRWCHFAWMKLAVTLLAVAMAAEAKTTLGQVCATIALLAVIIDFVAEFYSDEGE